MTLAGAASASETASATVTATPLGGGQFQYNIALKNTSADSTKIGSFWFSWIPGYDFLAANPTTITQPTGWTESIENIFGAGNGYSIEWVNGGGAADQLSAGSIDNFSFQSTETPTQMQGQGSGPIGQFYTQTTSYVYAGAPQAPGDSGFFMSSLPVSVPEPMSLSVVVIGAAGLMLRRRSATTGRA
jgi:hypothetical protein